MSKAEERALEAYPLRDTEHVYDEGHVIEAREYFVEGYHQAEKDLELTWKDIESICSIQYIVLNEYNDYDEPPSNILYQEVLKRFNNLKRVY